MSIQSDRVCENCQHLLCSHMEGQDGYTRPCLIPGCSCTCFTDKLQRYKVRYDPSPLGRLLNAVWDVSESAVVFKKPDGTYSFPTRNDKPTPPGYERVEIRSDADMARIERDAGVQSERRWFDPGSGREHEKELAPVPRRSG